MPALVNAVSVTEQSDSSEAEKAKALETVIRIVTMLGGDSRVVDHPNTVAHYIGTNRIRNLPSHIPVLFKQKV